MESLRKYGIGDLVVVQTSVNPCLQIGRLMGDRLNINGTRNGVILAFEDHWAEDWAQILFSTGIGWIKIDWIE